jgi:predicted permease
VKILRYTQNDKIIFVIASLLCVVIEYSFVILSRFCEGSSSRGLPGEDSYSMVLRTASTQAVAVLRMTQHFLVAASEARQSGVRMYSCLPLSS